LLLALGVSGLAMQAIAAGAQGAAPAGGADPAAACLQCHGPFEKLAGAPARFVAPSGEKVNPHRFVPHDLTDVPECTGCHQPHSAAPKAAELAALPRPNVKSCFECHHKQNFGSCQSCHKRE
jgi:predicted CXXCH cytochrome family protein